MKNLIRRALWKILGNPAQFQDDAGRAATWQLPADTVTPRRVALDMAIYNVHIGTRNERAQLNNGHPVNYGAAECLLGDYLEFGVYQGASFAHCYHRASALMPWMRFFAFDSFQGLPELTGTDRSGEFVTGQFSCDQQTFEANLSRYGVTSDRIVVVPGWFDSTLNDDTRSRLDLRVAAIAFIDCDLYESCVPVLDFLSPLVRQGTILLFDDWLHFKGRSDKGVQRAANEWLERNPQLSLTPWLHFSHHGQAFVVNRESSQYPA